MRSRLLCTACFDIDSTACFIIGGRDGGGVNQELQKGNRSGKCHKPFREKEKELKIFVAFVEQMTHLLQATPPL